MGRGSSHAHELARRLELLVLRAQAFELESERRSGRLRELPTPISALAGREALPDRLAHDRQRLLGRVLEDPTERLSGVGVHELAQRVADRVKDIAEKLLELLFARHLEKL